ncbi:DedA family protein [Alphaproteobacteria bacterium GH1-50]|uniref:DedA family protein n=1 Tax=Kangsaoukella pontilimi TaxID=2691042 RepID=A0A7C9MJV8_9RHOB|nr:DedA family protein [Kangsaoukella pontilimi]MXQ08075.1 DedA family protein [Kangsaoukella pontilimi]
MNELLFGYVSVYGLPIVGLAAFLSCLAVPIPTFAVMLAAGAFAATGDLVLWQVLAVAWLAAVAGDQTGFRIGRWGGAPIVESLSKRPTRAVLIERAMASIRKWGGTGVFFSTWLVAPLGPWMNLAAGASGMGWLRFTLWDGLGEAIWVCGYVGLGYLFGSELDRLTTLLGDWAGLTSSLAITALLGVILWRTVRRRAP